MKKLLVFILILGFFGCSEDDDTKFYTFSGQVLQYPELTPAVNSDITLSTTAYRELHPEQYDLRSGKTDADGRYEFQIPAEEFSTSLFLYENHPSYTVRIKKSGYLQLPNFIIRGLFPGSPINPGEPIVGGPTNPIGNPPEDYFEKEIKLGRESFLSFSAESLDTSIDSVYLIVYHLVPNEDDPTIQENRFFRSFIFHENYEAVSPTIRDFPVAYLGRGSTVFPLDTTLVYPISFDPDNKLSISWTQYSGTDSLKLTKDINLIVGESVEVFD